MTCIPNLNIEELKNSCKGRVYRCTINQYYSSHKSIEVRKSLRLLKRESCSGCEKCEWLDEFLSEEISNLSYTYNKGDYLQDLSGDKKYKLKTIWHPGPYEYPQDGDLEVIFKEVK